MARFILDLRPDAVLNRLVPPHMEQVANRIRDEAIAIVPRGTDHPDRLGREYHPPLWTTIETKPSPGAAAAGSTVRTGAFLVGSSEEHALYLHEGAPFHYVEPSSGGRLVFWWKKRGRIFIGDIGQVTRHPGTHAVPFLVEAARRVLGR